MSIDDGLTVEGVERRPASGGRLTSTGRFGEGIGPCALPRVCRKRQACARCQVRVEFDRGARELTMQRKLGWM